MIVIGGDDCLFFDARCVDIYVERELEATITLDTYQVHTYNRNLQNNNESLSLSDQAAAASRKEYHILYLTLSIVLAPVSATSVAKRLLPDLKVSRRLFSPLIVSVGLQQSFINTVGK